MKTKFILLATLACLLISCKATLTHYDFHKTTRKNNGNILVQDKADGMHSFAGFGSITAFAIPVAPVLIQNNPDTDFMLQVKDALEHAGYSTKLISDTSKNENLPILSCKVNKVKFWNYTWFFPFVWNWGRFEVTFTISSPSGKKLWEKSYIAKAKGWYSFDPTVRKAMTNLLDKLIFDLTDEQPILSELAANS